jgi:signal transduction histidine kinase
MPMALEYSQMTSVPLAIHHDGSSDILEIIVTVSEEQTARFGLLRDQALLIAKTFDVLTHSYDLAGFGLLQLVLVVPTGLGFSESYLIPVVPAGGDVIAFSEEARRITSTAVAPDVLATLAALDSEDPFDVTEFYEQKLRKLHEAVSTAAIHAKFSEALQRFLQQTNSDSVVRIDSKSALLRVRSPYAHLDYAILVSYGSEPRFLSEEELGTLCVVCAAANHALTVGAMSEAYTEVNDIYIQMLKAHGNLRRAEVDQLTPAVFSLAQLMALAQIHEISRAWNDMMPSLETALRTYAERSARNDPAASAGLSQIESSTSKINEHLGRLNRIIRLAIIQRKTFNLVSLLSRVVKETRTAHPSIRVWLSPSSGAAWILGSEEHIRMAFDNLLANAVYFLTEEDRKRHIPEIGVFWSCDGSRARVEVYDNGPGIAEGIRHKIFLPLVSFKERGKGMGLGLPIASLILNIHHGSISVSSMPGEWTRFNVELPVINVGE